MKPFAMFYLIFTSILISEAQTINVVKKNHKVKSATATGHAVELKGGINDAETILPKFLKNYGKTRSNVGFTTVSNPFLNGITYEGKIIYATIEGNETQCEVWIGLDTAEWNGEDIPRILDRVNKVVYQFGVRFYHDLVQKEIDESQQAFDATEKQKTRLTNQNKDLNIRLGNNEQEKIHLEKSLEANALEKAVLLQKLENNKKAQDSVSNAGIQIKKVLDAQIEKQKKIN
jgi:hypothetical protein